MSKNRQYSSISVKQARAIPRVLEAKSIEAGCAAAGISKTLFYQWLKVPEFEREYKRQRNILIDEAMESLKASAAKAVDSLTSLLDTDSASLKRSVANDILGHILKIREIQDIEERLARLEQTMGGRNE